jgi:ribosomal protein L35AE/L33A
VYMADDTGRLAAGTVLRLHGDLTGSVDRLISL